VGEAGKSYYLLGHRAAFDFIRAQKNVRSATDCQRELPPQIGGVLDTSVHALGPGRAMDVSGVTGEKDPSNAIPAGQSVLRPNRLHPLDVRKPH